MLKKELLRTKKPGLAGFENKNVSFPDSPDRNDTKILSSLQAKIKSRKISGKCGYKDEPGRDNIKPFIKTLEIFKVVIQRGKKKVPYRSLPINNKQ